MSFTKMLELIHEPSCFKQIFSSHNLLHLGNCYSNSRKSLGLGLVFFLFCFFAVVYADFNVTVEL